MDLREILEELKRRRVVRAALRSITSSGRCSWIRTSLHGDPRWDEAIERLESLAHLP